MAKNALIVWGGWDGHQPEAVAGLTNSILSAEGFNVEVSDTLAAFESDGLRKLDLIVPVWTMGEITQPQVNAVCEAVAAGTGLAGCHGGMCDAFRACPEWQFLTGGQWVAHPGDTNAVYTVEIDASVPHPVTDGLSSFEVASEQYYLHTDPGNTVLATTRFPNTAHPGPHSQNPCDMPQVWTKMYGQGRVFYTAIGHRAADLETGTSREIYRRGLLWAAREL